MIDKLPLEKNDWWNILNTVGLYSPIADEILGTCTILSQISPPSLCFFFLISFPPKIHNNYTAIGP